VRCPSLALVVCLVTGFALAGCGGSSRTQNTGPADTKVNPGPNPTTGDPGPNNTANGPQTLQGTLTAHTTCLELDGNAANEPSGRYQLEFSAEKVQRKGTTIVLSAKDGSRTVHPHDVAYVAGHPETGSGPCGALFLVDKVVAVTPG
jgi:hypothetical protein